MCIELQCIHAFEIQHSPMRGSVNSAHNAQFTGQFTGTSGQINNRHVYIREVSIMAKQITVADGLIRELDIIRVNYNCTYTKAIQLYGSNASNPRNQINGKINEIKEIVLNVYKDDVEIYDQWSNMLIEKSKLLKLMASREADKVLPGQEEEVF